MSTLHWKSKETDNWKTIEARSRQALPQEIVDYIASCRTDEHPDGHLISVLHKVQSHFGYLGTDQMDAVAQLMQIPIAKITGVATFYHFFRLNPAGKFMINVCLGTACYVQGAQAVVERLKEELGIDFGETTPDGMFTLEGTRCLGTCGLAPVMTINEEVHAKVTPDQIPLLIKRYVDQARAE